jgi:hypothetical protein
MPGYLTKNDFCSLISKKTYSSEKELETEVLKKLPALLKVKPSQVDNQFITTTFDANLSNCADIVVRSDEEIPHVLLIIELKIDRNINKYHNENYTLSARQLQKYCQDVRALYGVILTDNVCLMYHYDFHNLINDRNSIDKIPYPNEIDKELGRWSIIDAVCHQSNYQYFFITISATLYLILLTILRFIGH